jgi:hypothetical protein
MTGSCLLASLLAVEPVRTAEVCARLDTLSHPSCSGCPRAGGYPWVEPVDVSLVVARRTSCSSTDEPTWRDSVLSTETERDQRWPSVE